MTKSIFIASTEPYSGKSVVALGLVNMLLGKTKKIAYFKPIVNIDSVDGKDTHIQTIIEYFNLGLKYEDAYAFTRTNLMRQTENDEQGSIYNTIIHKFKKLEE